MPWNMNDYPSSLKNLEKPVRKKAIDIANAMLDEGYDEGKAIPIATKQAEKWYDDADKQEIDDYMDNERVTPGSSSEYESRPELMEKAELVESHEDGWAVRSKDAQQPAAVYDKKNDAVKRAKEIAEKQGTEAVIYKKDGSIETRYSY